MIKHAWPWSRLIIFIYHSHDTYSYAYIYMCVIKIIILKPNHNQSFLLHDQNLLPWHSHFSLNYKYIIFKVVQFMTIVGAGKTRMLFIWPNQWWEMRLHCTTLSPFTVVFQFQFSCIKLIPIIPIKFKLDFVIF